MFCKTSQFSQKSICDGVPFWKNCKPTCLQLYYKGRHHRCFPVNRFCEHNFLAHFTQVSVRTCSIKQVLLKISENLQENTFFQLLYLEPGFLFIAYLTVVNLVRLGISVHCQVSGRSQYLVRLLSWCWITGGHTIHPAIYTSNWYRTHTVPKFGLKSN